MYKTEEVGHWWSGYKILDGLHQLQQCVRGFDPTRGYNRTDNQFHCILEFSNRQEDLLCVCSKEPGEFIQGGKLLVKLRIADQGD